MPAENYEQVAANDLSPIITGAPVPVRNISTAELDDLWRKRVKDEVLRMKIAGKDVRTLRHGMAGAPGLLVLGLPRGGVPVAHEVAQALGAPLDVLLARKLGVRYLSADPTPDSFDSTANGTRIVTALDG